MGFSTETLNKIVVMGSQGSSPTKIAGELNMTYDQLLDLCKTDEKFKDAYDRAVVNFERYLVDKILEGSTSKGAKVQTEVFKKLIDKHGGNNDNRIEIEYV